MPSCVVVEACRVGGGRNPMPVPGLGDRGLTGSFLDPMALDRMAFPFPAIEIVQAGRTP